tara:strand:- start:12 stop:176 length:165 start_codon:yes stop_codon:yes gene_type:complete
MFLKYCIYEFILNFGVNFVIETNVIDNTIKLINAKTRFKEIINIGSKIKGNDST